jgi:diguanylate cyclase (GGDEF)-like protein
LATPRHAAVDSMHEKKKIRLSLRQVLTIPYVVLVLALALTIVGLSYSAGSRAVDAVSSHLLMETVGRIGQAVDRHIMGSGAVLEAAFPDGMPAGPSIDSDVEALRTRFWIATSLHTDPNNYVYYGNRQGQGIGLFRLSSTEGELRIKLKAQDLRTFYRFTGINGALRFHAEEGKLFDPRVRPWYKAGETRNDQTWTSVYIDFGTSDLVATRARRVLGFGGGFEGVVATDVSLRALNNFVTNLRVSRNGLAFIVEPNGDLIASSAGPNVRLMPDGSKARVSAADGGSALVKAIYAEVQVRLQSQGPLSGAQTLSFKDADQRLMHVGFDRLRDDSGLEWITVVALPRSDFMTGVTENLIRTAMLGALAAVIAIALGLRILSWVSGDLKRLSEAAMRVGEGQLAWPVGISRADEIGQLASSFETMQQRLQTDALTGLANRESFMLRLRSKIAQVAAHAPGAGFAVLFIDLNHFKRVNDRYGHGTGDAVLVEVAQRLRATVRSHDLVARLSGDEFVVLLDRVDAREDLQGVRVHIAAVLQQPLSALEDGAIAQMEFGGSVGEAYYPDDGTDAESLLKKADRRMYKDKFQHRPQDSEFPRRRASDPKE